VHILHFICIWRSSRQIWTANFFRYICIDILGPMLDSQPIYLLNPYHILGRVLGALHMQSNYILMSPDDYFHFKDEKLSFRDINSVVLECFWVWASLRNCEPSRRVHLYNIWLLISKDLWTLLILTCEYQWVEKD
jgi:hypothetical protein